MTAHLLIASDISQRLAADFERLAAHLLGKPTYRSSNEWRYGRKGSLVCTMRGEQRGRWYDFEAGAGGDALDLIRREGVARDIREAMAWGAQWLGEFKRAPERKRTRPAPSRPEPILDDAALRKRRTNRENWRARQSISGTLAEAYFRHARGIALTAWPDDLGFHPSISPNLAPQASGERFPAVMGLMRDIRTGEPQSVHYTLLDSTGRRRLDLATDGVSGRKFYGPAAGAANMLSPFAEVTTRLAITEGIETGLSVLMVGLGPVWALGSAGAIAKFPMLSGIECLEIFADHGEAGVKAARECADRWSAAGVETLISVTRDHATNDINDLFRQEARCA